LRAFLSCLGTETAGSAQWVTVRGAGASDGTHLVVRRERSLTPGVGHWRGDDGAKKRGVAALMSRCAPSPTRACA
jgi:hypothetical protein